MPFEKGRIKTGGRTKKEDKPVSVRKSVKLVDKLLDNGFDFHKEFAKALRDLPDGSGPTGTKFSELKALLPYMAPKLREKEIEMVEPTEAMPTEEQLSTEDLLKAINGPEEKENKPRASDPPVVGEGDIKLLLPASSEVDLQHMASEQETE